MLKAAVRVASNRLPQIRAGLAPGAKRAAMESARRIQQDWAGDVRVDTGAYRSSIVASETPTGAVIFSGVPHAYVNEYGGRTISARPSARKAAEANAAAYRSAVARLVAG